MEKIKQFLEDFIDVEHKAACLSILPDIEAFNKQLEFMDSFLADDLKSRFDMLKLTEPESDEYYEEMSVNPPMTKRHLFKIDEIGKNEIFYRAFVSMIDGKKEYFHCFVIRELKGKLLITSRFTWGIGRDGINVDHWYFSGGEEMKYTDLKPIKETLRLLAPENNEENMKEYLQ